MVCNDGGATGRPATTGDRILEATLRAIAERGLERLTMSAVSAAAAVSRPTRYRWFPTQECLREALASYEQRRFDDGLLRAVEDEAAPADRLDAALRYLVGFLETSPGRQVVDLEPAFVLRRLNRSLGPHAQSLARLLGGALAFAPAVRRGETTPAEISDTLVRLAYSHYLVPHPDSDQLLRTLRGLVRIPSEGASHAAR
ncbi:MAG: TetR/AcrR family transcriptional regulator [Acidimicrobiales bacterium]